MTKINKGTHHLLLVWLIFTGLVIFSLYVAWNEGILYLLYNGDKSKISWIITLLYILVTLHCAYRIYLISNQLNMSAQIEKLVKTSSELKFGLLDNEVLVNETTKLPESVLSEYIRDLLHNRKTELNTNASELSGKNSDLIDVYESRLKNPQEIGWFVTDVMIKLGLLGTIIGFVLMLGSVADVSDFDVSTMQNILKNMSSGMGTALFTTFAGLVCSILAGMQYHLLDQGADKLIETAKHISHVHILPSLNNHS